MKVVIGPHEHIEHFPARSIPAFARVTVQQAKTIFSEMKNLVFDRSGKSAFYAPSVAQSGKKRRWFDMQFFGPHCYRLLVTLKLYQSIIPSIVGLFYGCSPLYVFRRIISIIINTLKRMFRRGAFAHIIVKIWKLHPSWADGNPPTSIVWKTSILRIKASSSHRTPNAPQRGMSVAVGLINCSHIFTTKTSATANVSRLQITGLDVGRLPTVTPAMPILVPVMATAKADHGQPTESQTFDVNKTRISGFKGKIGKIYVRHFASMKGNLFRLGEVFSAPFRAVFSLTFFMPKMEVYYR